MLELYHHGSSACAAKVRFALAEKHLFHYRYARAALIERALDAAERRRGDT